MKRTGYVPQWFWVSPGEPNWFDLQDGYLFPSFKTAQEYMDQCRFQFEKRQAERIRKNESLFREGVGGMRILKRTITDRVVEGKG